MTGRAREGGAAASSGPQVARRIAAVAGHVLWERLRRHRPADADDVPRSADALTSAWLTAVLCRDHPGAEVTSFEILGGSSGTSTRTRLRVTYNDAGRRAGLPSDLYAKTTTSLKQRLMLGLTAIIPCEAGFYERVRPELDIEAPQGYFAAVEPRSWRSITLIENVSATKGATFCSPQTVISREQMEDLLADMASWHGAYWNHPELERGWLQSPSERFRAVSRFLSWRKRSQVGARRAGDVIPAPVRDNHDAVFDAFERSMELGSQGPQTFLHGDPHSAGNFYVTADGRMGYADWGVCLHGGWGYDFAYTVVASLTVADRRAWERDLLAFYLERLAASGGDAPGFDQAWLTYRQQTLYPYIGWAFTNGQSAAAPELQPPEYCLPIIERSSHAVDDLDALDALRT